MKKALGGVVRGAASTLLKSSCEDLLLVLDPSFELVHPRTGANF